MDKIYGIDLGTTNSAIAFNGNVIGGMVPSIVNFKDGKVGKSQEENYEATRSFKVDISLGREGAESIKASSLVLRELVNQVKETTGDIVTDVVISVPAFFSDNQRQATKKAAEDIGLNVRALINEPTAAAIRYNKDSRSVTVVYDLGGGTFDVTVIDSRIGVLDVQATDGIIVGGDTLDRNIFKFLVKRMGIKIHRLVASQRVALEHYSRSIKHLIQKVGDVEVDLTDFEDLVTQHKMMFKADEYVEIMKHTFKETIVQLKKVIAQSVEEDDDVSILLVGGSTRDPYLQEWIKAETQLPVNEIDYNQDLIVAEGASIYAGMIANGEVHSKIIEVTRAISIEYQDGTSKVVIRDGEALPARGRITVRTAEDTDTLQLNIYQGDRVLASQNELIGTMIWSLGEIVPKGAEPLMVEIQVNLSGIITVKARRIKGNEQIIVLDRGKVT